MQEFAKADLPLFVTDAQNYFQTFELVMIMNYLRLIDNPQQDIPLVAVLRSPLFNFICFLSVKIYSLAVGKSAG